MKEDSEPFPPPPSSLAAAAMMKHIVRARKSEVVFLTIPLIGVQRDY
jgi:hypothetical protein